jgi:phage shock protein A
MIEIAVRVKELAASNVNSLVDRASRPEKLLRLMITELEEAIIALSRDAMQADRRSDQQREAAKRHEAVAAEWQDKAKFALSKDRQDLARGALAERETALEAARSAKDAAKSDTGDAKEQRETVAALEARLAEARARLSQHQASAAATASPSTVASSRTDRIIDRVDSLEKRLDFASAAEPPRKAASLDDEIAAMAREAKVEAELAALSKAGSRKR